MPFYYRYRVDKPTKDGKVSVHILQLDVDWKTGNVGWLEDPRYQLIVEFPAKSKFKVGQEIPLPSFLIFECEKVVESGSGKDQRRLLKLTPRVELALWWSKETKGVFDQRRKEEKKQRAAHKEGEVDANIVKARQKLRNAKSLADVNLKKRSRRRKKPWPSLLALTLLKKRGACSSA